MTAGGGMHTSCRLAAAPCGRARHKQDSAIWRSKQRRSALNAGRAPALRSRFGTAASRVGGRGRDPDNARLGHVRADPAFIAAPRKKHLASDPL